jgi:hypothetical protein
MEWKFLSTFIGIITFSTVFLKIIHFTVHYNSSIENSSWILRIILGDFEQNLTAFQNLNINELLRFEFYRTFKI